MQYVVLSVTFFSPSYSPVMVEGVAQEVSEDTFCEAVLFAHQEVHHTPTMLVLALCRYCNITFY